MVTYGYSNNKRRLDFVRITGVIAILSAALAIGSFVRFKLVDKKIETGKQQVEVMVEQNKKMEQQTVQLQDEIKTLEDKALNLEEILWRHEPVVIPDSMK